jgi:hypothetical protein
VSLHAQNPELVPKLILRQSLHGLADVSVALHCLSSRFRVATPDSLLSIRQRRDGRSRASLAIACGASRARSGQTDHGLAISPSTVSVLRTGYPQNCVYSTWRAGRPKGPACVSRQEGERQPRRRGPEYEVGGLAFLSMSPGGDAARG